MDFETALKTVKDAESVGGQLIAHRHGVNVLVGKNVQGVLIVEETTEAKLIMSEVDGDAPEPKTHEIKVDDKVETKDAVNTKK